MPKLYAYLLVSVLCFGTSVLHAQIMSGDQHQYHSMQMGDTDMVMMSHAFSPNLPMSRDGSGTAWMPDASPMNAYTVNAHKWMFMFHGSIFFRYTMQDIFRGGGRGGQRFSAPNWVMAMVQRKVGNKDLFSFNLMMSLERLTESGNGYPLLFQSGETWDGKRLVDHQHPHDLFSGLSIGYTHAFTKDVDLTAYFGYPGEPALGPVAFMHRLSAINNPDAPISHHWQDATHITFGVATLGVRWKWLKAEGSIFTGREPNENRYNFDKPLFDSYSYRLSVNPNKEFALQFSQGFIHSPEELEPSVNVRRTTVSLIHSHQFAPSNTYITSTLVWGMNENQPGFTEHSILLESNLQWKHFAAYCRYEWAQKDSAELALPLGHMEGLYNVQAITLGTSVRILEVVKTYLHIGAQVTLNIPDKLIKDVYGQLPIGFQLYLHITPAIMQQHSMSMKDM